MPKKFQALNREHWLTQAIELARPIFEDKGLPLPDGIAVSCGFCLGKRTAIGQAWPADSSSEGRLETFISPVLADPSRVLDVLVHELLHHAVGNEHGHKAPFAKHLPTLGISGNKPTATEADDNFPTIWGETLKRLGEYPHAELAPTSPEKKQGVRQLKCECIHCGYICRTTAKWLEEMGAPVCPCQIELLGTGDLELEDLEAMVPA